MYESPVGVMPSIPRPEAVEAKVRAAVTDKMKEMVSGRDFYELCQQYRHSVIGAQEFEAIQQYLIRGILPWPSYEIVEREEE